LDEAYGKRRKGEMVGDKKVRVKGNSRGEKRKVLHARRRGRGDGDTRE